MIRYALKCGEAHRFEAWFGSSGDYDRLKAGGHVTCAVCGSGAVEKDLMAPAVGGGAVGGGAPDARGPNAGATAAGAPDLRAPASPAEQAIAALRKRIEATAENVGRDFASEARRIHEGASPERPIWGEALPAEAKALIEDGIPVAPLPWPTRRSN